MKENAAPDVPCRAVKGGTGERKLFVRGGHQITRRGPILRLNRNYTRTEKPSPTGERKRYSERSRGRNSLSGKDKVAKIGNVPYCWRSERALIALRNGD